MKVRAFLAVLLGLAMIASVVNATYVQVIGPVNSTLQQNGTTYLGKVGPGESFYVLASAATTNASGVPVNIGWDTFEAVQLPQGWSAQATPLYENPMKLKITTAPNTPNGSYKLVLRAVNIGNYSKLGNLTFIAFINVTTDVFNLVVTPTQLQVGPGQPYSLHVMINNTGASDDPFLINAQGLPAWNSSDEVIALHSTSSSFSYPVIVNEPGVYPFNLTVASATSPLISKSYRINMVVKASVLNDYAAIGQGVPLSPIIYEPMYAIMLLLHYIFTSL
ncbi:MAG: hypothetical protein KGH59_01180 [Candidatus Micrarchaeota archaeon]|nr:hypothetical protein [Candidatus Micrarchaeota archaeon]MDE1804379.1 hypothetical protein [Candidatus Micrarchaeota archaeon]MDE1846623.1 hypothetical protein [Candidatus Micrarchaeota archaeon]